MAYQIALDDGRVLDARIDLPGTSLTLHSRGGSTGGRPARNVDYALALIAICRRTVAQPGTVRRVLLDSAVAQQRSEADRVLVGPDEIAGLDGDGLAKAIRTRARVFGQAVGTIGGNSTKQVRFEFSLSHMAIVSLLRLQPVSAAASNPIAIARLTAAELRDVQPLHIRHAVDRLVAGEDASNFGPSRDYDVLTPGGDRLAPKKVFGLAVEQALGIEAFPSHFSAGWTQLCFGMIENAGYRIVLKNGQSMPPTRMSTTVPPDPEEQGWAEGDPRLAKHLRAERRRNPRAVAAKRNQVRAANGGRLRCDG